MTDPLGDLARRLAAGESLEAIARSLLPPDWTPTLRACAVARTFDAQLYEEVLRPPATGPGLDELIEARAVRPVSGAPGSYALSEADRASYFLDWIPVAGDDAAPPADLLDLERAIAGRRRALGDHAEAVRHLLLPAPADALALYHERFSEADERRDFAACQDLVEALGDPDRLPFVGPEIPELGLDHAGYVRARDHWAADYSRSAQFLQPAGLAEQAGQLLAGKRRVWQMHAPGGAGKTMQLRWLVARYCVPAPRDVPCARVDFDLVNPHTVGRHPWLLVLEMAEQFGRRLPGRPFESLADQGVYRILLDRRPSAPAREVAGAVDALDTEAVEGELVAAFAERLDLALGGRPAVLVLDTLEELLLHGHTEAERLLRMLAGLLERCPGLRLVLAGRYDLRDRVPNGLRAFPASHVKHIRVRPFSSAQARSYLTEVRAVTDARLVRVATRKANGLPFALALLADVIQQDPSITAGELEACDAPLVRYLIERVVLRIDDPAVRWLVRYGVIPRRLRKEDVLTVMREKLAGAVTGRSGTDDPREDHHHLRGSDDVFPLTTAEPTDDDLERAWQRLLDYAAKSSWVSRHAGDDSTVVFHTNVLAPMRLLVSDHPVFAELHHAFVAHFDALAGAYPEQWAAYTKEALYHRFQAADPQAESAWSTAVVTAGERERPDLVRELCEEVLGDEYLDEGRPRLRLDGEPIISVQSVVRAHLAVAGAVMHDYLDVPKVNPSDPAWNEVERRLALIERLAPESAESIGAHGLAAELRALVLFGRGRLAEAEELVRATLAPGLDDEVRQDLQLLLSRIQSQSSDPGAEETYREAMHTARARGGVASEARISLELAHNLGEMGRIDEAIALHRQVTALQDPQGQSEPALAEIRHRAVLHLAYAQLTAIEPSTALKTLSTFPANDAPAADRIDACHAEELAHTVLGRSRPALEALGRADRIAENDIADATRYRHLAEIAVRRGVIEGRLLYVDEAERSFARAAALFSEWGYPDGHPSCLLEYARFLARDMGDLRRAADALDRVRMVDQAGEFAVGAALLWHELVGRGHDVPDRSVLDIPQRTVADLLAGGVAAVVADPGRAPALADALGSVQPPAARLRVFAGLSRITTPDGAPPPGLDLLRPLFEPLADGDPTSVDHHLRLTRLAEFERVSGRGDAAERLVAQAYPVLCAAADPGDPFPKWLWVQAQMRLRGLPERGLCESLRRTAPAAPPLLGAIAHWLVARAEGDTEVKRELLRAAAESVGQVHRPSVWAHEVLRSVADVNEDESTRRAAVRMAAALGHPPDESAPQAAPAPSLVALAENEDVYRVVPPVPSGAALQEIAQSLSSDWAGAARAVEDSLRCEARGRRPLHAVQIQGDSITEHVFPWELAFLKERTAVYRTMPVAAEAADVRAIQATLKAEGHTNLVTDGVWGRLTQLAVATAVGAVAGPAAAIGVLSGHAVATLLHRVKTTQQRARSGTGPQVVVLRPDSPFDNHSYAASGSAVSASASLTLRSYQALGHATCEGHALGRLPKLQDPPAVVHVRAPLRLRGGRIPCFDLSSTDLEHGNRLSRTAMGTDLDPDGLIDWLSEFQAGTQPLVVLDPPRPGSVADIPWQLVLRNLFAAHLFASGCAPAVLGVGLLRGGGYQAVRQLNHLARAVGDGTALLRLYERLHNRVGPPPFAGWGQDVLECRSVCLFASPAALRVSEIDPRLMPR
ncbi:hypothetical protein [Streptomyces sp. NPDC008137]|uniref:hypothetical protein n=1 Tax=Streptomyces sp. NPDC008137 TaxID=3364813 RepID=UPI0036EF3AFE